MPKSLNIQDIMEMLPHRFPFLLIDRVVELSDELDRVVAIKNVTMNEPQFTGHFPQAPVMPGVLIVEAMAQAKAMHDELEGLYNPHVDFDRVYQTAQAITDELTARL